MEAFSELIDDVVVDAHGRHIGTIDELIVDLGSGRILKVIIKRADHSRSSVSWSELTIGESGFVLCDSTTE